MNIKNQKWSGRLLRMAKNIATWSKDDSTRVGAVITTEHGEPLSWGFNGMPMGIDDSVPERSERPLKYKWYAHAEQNAIDLAKSNLNGSIMFVTFSPCSSCARSIIQNKIKTVVIDSEHAPEKMPERWKEDMSMAIDMLKEAGIEIIIADAKL